MKSSLICSEGAVCQVWCLDTRAPTPTPSTFSPEKEKQNLFQSFIFFSSSQSLALKYLSVISHGKKRNIYPLITPNGQDDYNMTDIKQRLPGISSCWDLILFFILPSFSFISSFSERNIGYILKHDKVTIKSTNKEHCVDLPAVLRNRTYQYH